MPESALEQVPDARVVSLSDMPSILVQCVAEPIGLEEQAAEHTDDPPEKETRFAEFDMSEIEAEQRLGRPSPFACPDCGGVLWELEGKEFLRYRCRVGHAFTARHLGAEQRHAVETALWSALRALEESASLYRRMAERATGRRHEATSDQFEERAKNINANARILKDFLLRVNEKDPPDAADILESGLGGLVSPEEEEPQSDPTARRS